MPTVAFHVTSTRNRASILRHGLDWRRMVDDLGLAGSELPERACVFLARDMEEAEFFVSISRGNHKSVDVWEATLPHEFDLYADPPDESPYGEIDGFLFTTDPIPASRLRLIRKDV
jgi:hypothetical protein